MKKKLILIILCLFCFGCEAKYELTINEDLTVNEAITGLEDEDFYNNYYKSTKERVISFMTETKDEYLNELGYSKQIVNQGNLTGALFSHKFNSLEEYFEKSQAYSQFYEEINYEMENGIVDIKLENQLLKNEDSIERYDIDNCDISITLPFKVKSNNADSVDKKTNTYTWNLNNEKGKDIKIKFDTNRIYKYKDFNMAPYLISGIVVFCGTIIFILYRKNKKNNKID